MHLHTAAYPYTIFFTVKFTFSTVAFLVLAQDVGAQEPRSCDSGSAYCASYLKERGYTISYSGDAQDAPDPDNTVYECVLRNSLRMQLPTKFCEVAKLLPEREILLQGLPVLKSLSA